MTLVTPLSRLFVVCRAGFSPRGARSFDVFRSLLEWVLALFAATLLQRRHSERGRAKRRVRVERTCGWLVITSAPWRTRDLLSNLITGVHTACPRVDSAADSYQGMTLEVAEKVAFAMFLLGYDLSRAGKPFYFCHHEVTLVAEGSAFRLFPQPVKSCRNGPERVTGFSPCEIPRRTGPNFPSTPHSIRATIPLRPWVPRNCLLLAIVGSAP